MITVPTIFKAIDQFTAPLRKMDSSMNRFTATVEVGAARADRSLRKMIPSFGGLSNQILGLASAASLMAGVSHATNTVLEFETGLVGVGKTTGIVGDELTQLGSDIVKTSNELRTIKSSTLLELAGAAGQLGVTGSQNILVFSSTMAKLEKASDVAGEEGAKSIARLLNITGEGVGIVDRFGSALVGLGNNSAASEAEILSVASEVGRSTAAYGLASDQILGISTALKSLDVSPEAAGTAVGKVFKGIEMAVLKGGKPLYQFSKIMGMSQAEVKKTFAESPTEAFSMFIKGLNRISNEGGSVAKALDDVGMSGQIVSKGIVPLATNYDLLNDKLVLANTEFEKNTALNNEFEASQKTISSSLTALTSKWENYIIEQSTAGSGMEKIRNLIDLITNNLDGIINAVITAAYVFVAWKSVLLATNAVLAIQRGYLGAKAVMDMAKYISMTQGISKSTALWSIIQAELNTIMMMNPIGLIVAGVALLIAAVVIIIRYWDEWGAALTVFMGPLGFIISAFQSFRRNWEMVTEAFKNGGILEGLKAIGKVLLDAILMPMQQLLEIASNLPGDLGKMAASGAASIQAYREGLGVNMAGNSEPETAPAVDANQARAEYSTQSLEQKITEKNMLEVLINDSNGRASTRTEGPMTNVNVSSTMGVF